MAHTDIIIQMEKKKNFLFISVEESLQWLYFVKIQKKIILRTKQQQQPNIKIFISQENDLYGQTKSKDNKLFETKNYYPRNGFYFFRPTKNPMERNFCKRIFVESS